MPCFRLWSAIAVVSLSAGCQGPGTPPDAKPSAAPAANALLTAPAAPLAFAAVTKLAGAGGRTFAPNHVSWQVDGMAGKVTKYDEKGAKAGEYALPADYAALEDAGNTAAADAAGNFWTLYTGGLVHITPAGTVAGPFPLPGRVGNMEMDGQGTVWVREAGTKVYKVAADGSVAKTVDLGIPVDTLVPIAAGGVWAQSTDPYTNAHVDVDGRVTCRFPSELTGLPRTVDPAGNLYIAGTAFQQLDPAGKLTTAAEPTLAAGDDGTALGDPAYLADGGTWVWKGPRDAEGATPITLYHLSPALALLGQRSVTLPYGTGAFRGFVADRAGSLWFAMIASESQPGALVRVKPDGSLATFAVGVVPYSLEVGQDGRLRVIHQDDSVWLCTPP